MRQMEQPFFITKDQNKLIVFKQMYKKIRVNGLNFKRALQIVEEETAKNRYVVAALDYELGENLLPSLHGSFLNKGWLLFFNEYEEVSGLESEFFALTNFKLEMQRSEYEKKYQTIIAEIKKGNTYQINLTTFLKFNFYGSVLGFFKYILTRQETPYNSLFFDGKKYILSASPELFFKIENEEITVKPMKGTAPLSAGRDFLASDEKNLAENVMIVDLLRNDLGRICQKVKVDRLFDVEKYQSLYQMTSTITGKLIKKNYYEIFKALFPCGSVTGAPKISSMKIIKRLERGRRGIYTGGIGCFSRDVVVMSIPIRTIEIEGTQAKMGVGSGLTICSDYSDEYREIILKTNFLRKQNNFYLIETLLWDGLQYRELELHLKRLKKSAAYFKINYNEKSIIERLLAATLDISLKSKITLQLWANGRIKVIANEFKPWRAGKIKLQQVRPHKFAGYKTSNRFNADLNECMEVIWYTSQKELLEGSISNIFLKIKGRYYTPPLKSAILPGLERKKFIKENQVRIKKLYLSDLQQAEEIVFTNSVRGVIKITDLSLIEGL